MSFMDGPNPKIKTLEIVVRLLLLLERKRKSDKFT